jgi:hypothetical protein
VGREGVRILLHSIKNKKNFGTENLFLGEKSPTHIYFYNKFVRDSGNSISLNQKQITNELLSSPSSSCYEFSDIYSKIYLKICCKIINLTT